MRTELIGQPFITTAINKIALSARKSDPHVLLLVGPAGVGKMLAATQLMRRLLCEQEGELDCRCRSCLKIDINSHEAVEPIGDEFGIDRIREIVRGAYDRQTGRKVVLIGRFDRLSQAANQALLKATEEPTARTTWILTSRTEPIRTIVSRSWALRFGLLGEPALRQIYGYGNQIDLQQDVQIGASGGSVRPGLKTRWDYLSFAWPGLVHKEEFLPEKLDGIVLRADLELAVFCVAEAARRRIERFGPVEIPRCNDEKVAAILAVLDEALQMDSVRPWLVLMALKKRLEDVMEIT